MGNCFAKPTEQKLKSSGGRVVGSGTPNTSGVAKVSVPAPASASASAPKQPGTQKKLNPSEGRKLADSETYADAKAAAALAAEKRLESKKPTGKLSAQLEQERKKSTQKHLAEAAKENSAAKDGPLVFD